ncbi:immunoglobulin-like domain-containing protein [Melittangium boletus]|uniref:immunoglobulin-like domain-containing protein n=1 Tax=Melittangium boletus TaxID=83453 RepID=UPI003DA4BE80
MKRRAPRSPWFVSRPQLSFPTALLLATSACGPSAETAPEQAEVSARALRAEEGAMPVPVPTGELELPEQALAQTTVVLEPVADTFVRADSPTLNFGTTTSFSVCPLWPSWSTQPQEAFLRFDLGTLPANARVLSARLQATAHGGFAYGGDGNVYTQLVKDDTWNESTLTWNNRPAAEEARLGFWWLWYDTLPREQVGINTDPALASVVQAELQGDRKISLRLSSGGYKTHYYSREYADASRRPKLEITYELPGNACVDENKPTLVLTGSREVTLECGVDTWKEPGARAWDACGPVEVHYFNSGSDAHGPGPNTSQAGSYQIQYIAWNRPGYTVDTLRTVNVLDRNAPTLKLKGSATVTHTCGSQWVDPGVESRDACAGDLSATVTRTGDINSWAPGTYTLRYDVRDSSGNKAPTVTRTVNVINCPW